MYLKYFVVVWFTRGFILGYWGALRTTLSLYLLFLWKWFGLVVSIVVPLMLAVLPYARGRGFDSGLDCYLLFLPIKKECCRLQTIKGTSTIVWLDHPHEDYRFVHYMYLWSYCNKYVISHTVEYVGVIKEADWWIWHKTQSYCDFVEKWSEIIITVEYVTTLCWGILFLHGMTFLNWTRETHRSTIYHTCSLWSLHNELWD
jgi:hypothetical protein